MIGGEAALGAIRAAFAEPVDYLPGDSLPMIEGLAVIWSDTAGDPFQGPGNTTRVISAEIERDAVPARPNKKTRITRNGVVWKVIEVIDRDDVSAWVATLEVA